MKSVFRTRKMGKNADDVEEIENGKILYWGICMSSWWLWDIRGDDGDDHLESGMSSPLCHLRRS